MAPVAFVHHAVADEIRILAMVHQRQLEHLRVFQDANLVSDGVMHEGYWSHLLGLKGWPSVGEEIIVARNIMLAEMVDWHVHCQHLSSAGSVRLVREAKKRGVKISAEACPHHFTLTDENCQGYDTNFKMNPPLRTQRDVEAVLEGLADGTIEIISSDHAPHCAFEKEVEFDKAPFGILGLETELALSLMALVHRKRLTLPQLVGKFTTGPARLLRLDKGTLSVGADADITIMDPAREWVYDVNQTASKSRNTPFHGWSLKGKAVATIVGGRVAWKE